MKLIVYECQNHDECGLRSIINPICSNYRCNHNFKYCPHCGHDIKPIGYYNFGNLQDDRLHKLPDDTLINYNVPLTEQHDNANIEFNYEIAKEKLTFNNGNWKYTYVNDLTICSRLVDNTSKDDKNYNKFYLMCSVGKETSFNLSIFPNNEGNIDVLDDDWCQPYEYQNIDNNDFANNVLKKVYKIMTYLTEQEIISGWKVGDYI